MNMIYIVVLLGIAVFLLVFTLFVNKKVKYIKFLSSEVKVIKDEDFGKTIEVRGQDELAELCSSINNMSLELREKIDNEKSKEESLVDYIIRIIESNGKNDYYFIINQNIDITGYEKIVIENNPLNYKDNESIIYNPFSTGEANYRSIDPNYIVNEGLSKLQIEKNFTESERFNEIIELVYSLQEDKFTSKAQINKLYLELIMEILEKKGI